MYGCYWKRPGKEAKQGCVLKEQLVNGRRRFSRHLPVVPTWGICAHRVRGRCFQALSSRSWGSGDVHPGVAASLLQNHVQRLVHEIHSLKPFLTVEVQIVPAGGQSLRARERRKKVSLGVEGRAEATPKHKS